MFKKKSREQVQRQGSQLKHYYQINSRAGAECEKEKIKDDFEFFYFEVRYSMTEYYLWYRPWSSRGTSG